MLFGNRSRAHMVTILIVSYNTRKMTLACLRSVFEQTRDTPFELIVLDNASSDGSADAIESEFAGRVELIRSAENLGFARANNVAAERAKGECLLLLNPDTVVLDGAIDKLVAFAKERPHAGIWGGRTVYEDGSLNPASCWGRQTLWSVFCCASGLSSVFRNSSIFNTEGYGGWRRDTVRDVDIVSGCFLLIDRILWDRLDGFNPAYFMYGEESDLCLRSRRYGAAPIITPDATIVHHGGASERIREDKLVRLLRSKVMLIRDHWPGWLSSIGVCMVTLWPLSRALAWRVASPFFRRSCTDAQSVWAAIWHRRREWRDNRENAISC